MSDIRILKREQVEELLNMEEIFNCAEDVYKEKALKTGIAFPIVTYDFEPGEAEMDIKSGWLGGKGVYGLKLVSWIHGNDAMGLPMLTGTIMLIDDKTGFPLGFLDGGYITAARTGAAAAVGAKWLARPDSKTLLMVGTGLVSTYAIWATLMALPSIDHVLICNPNHPEKASRLAGKISTELNSKLGKQIQFNSTSNLKEATGNADVILTATPSRQPLIEASWIKAGTHLSCIGADMSGKEELDPMIFKDAKVFTDDMESCINLGEIEIPLKKGFLQKEKIGGEIGQVIVGQVNGRDNPQQITVFDTTGMGLMDLAVSKLALDKAEEINVGVLAEI